MIPAGAARKIRHGLLLTLWLLPLAACGGPPTWVQEGSGTMHRDDEKAFYGVGSVTGIKHNEPLAWDPAETRARAELARNFETYTAYLMRDYTAATTAGDFSATAEEQNVERAIKTFSSVTLRGARPIERYKDEESSTYYVLTKLSLADVKDALVQAEELDSRMRDFVRSNAERVFEQLGQEERRNDERK